MNKDTKPSDFEPVFKLLSRYMGCVMNGTVRVDVDDQNALELKRCVEEGIDFSLDVHENADDLFPVNGDASILDKLSTAREVAESLAHNNLTLSVLRNGKIVMIMGKNASPTISKLITRTDYIEIRNIIGLKRLYNDLSD